MFALSSNIIEDCKNTLQKKLVDQIFFKNKYLELELEMVGIGNSRNGMSEFGKRIEKTSEIGN